MVGQTNLPWLIPLALVGVQSSSLNDFSNNLATDLGPLLQLFGEPVTRQYLSESTTFLDYFIFAMAPIGILTAIVSVIRVCGDSSLRAFIGRSQEGDGQVEAELCTSTSRDVCELFNKGGITRVLGRPKILEIIQLPQDPPTSIANQASRDGHNAEDGRDDMGIFLFQDHLQNLQEHPSNSEWEERKPRHLKILDIASWRRRLQWLRSNKEGTRTKAPSTVDAVDKTPFAPNPNLSLNVGILKLPDGIFYSVAILGFVLQASVLVMAGLVSWKYKWTQDSTTTSESLQHTTIATIIQNDRAPLTFICGSVFMCLGMYLCAALIGQSTREYIYQRKQVKGDEAPKTRLFWLQPGNQVIGDQTFDAFAYTEDGSKRLTQYISSRMDLSDRSEFYTWIPLIVTVGGYVAQFIGLRGMNASVAIAQLGSSLVMSFLRGCLRMRRLARTDNKLGKVPDKVLKHELDWLAFELGTKDLANSNDQESQLEAGQWLWYPNEQPHDFNDNRSKPTGPWLSPIKLFRYRTRLAVLTGHPGRYIKQGAQAFQQWDNDQVQVRSMALCLQQAIEGCADALIGDHPPNNAESMAFSIPITMANDRAPGYLTTRLGMAIRKNPNPSVSDGVSWTVSSTEIEAILGLWLWSLKKVAHLEIADDYGNNISIAETIPNYRIIGFANDGYRDAMEMWLGESYRLESEEMILNTEELHMLHSMTFWRAETQESHTFVPWSVNDPEMHLRRLFGWTALNLDREARFDTIPVRCAPTGLSLLNQIGHELFASFIKHLYKEIGPGIGGVTIIDINGRLRWQNPVISNMVSRFEESGLGSSVDALLCLLPTLREVIRPPDGELVISALLKLSAGYRKAHYWERTEIFLRWTCNRYRPSYDQGSKTSHELGTKHIESFRSALIVTGELYRWALASKNRDTRVFGYNGIVWMLSHLRPTAQLNQTIKSNYEDPNDKDTNDILDRYQEISSLVAERLAEPSAFGRYKYYPKDSQTTELLDQDYEDEDLETKNKDLDDIWVPHRNSHSPKNAWDSSNDITPEPAEEDTDRDIEWKYDQENENDSPLRSKKNDSDSMSPLTLINGTSAPVDKTVIAAVKPSQEQMPKEKILKERIRTLYLLCFATSEDINERSLLKRSLARAAQNGWIEIATALIELRAVVDLSDTLKRTPIHYAAERGSISITSLLLAHGADPNEPDKNGQTPVLLATLAQAEHVVTMLLETRTVSPSTPDNSGVTPLISAARAGSISIVNILVRFGALYQSNAEDRSGRTALWYAALKGHVEIVRILLDYEETRADICDRSGLIPISVAGWEGHKDIFRQIYEKRQTDPNLLLLYPDGSRRTVLSIVIEQEFQDVFMLLLSDTRLNLQMRQIESRAENLEPQSASDQHPFNEEVNAVLVDTALGLTIQYNREAMFDSLMNRLSDKRFDIAHLDERPLAIAASYGRTSMVEKLLLNDKIGPNDGEPLVRAVSGGHSETVKTLLLDARVDVTKGQPLLEAIARGRIGVVQILLANSRFQPDERHLEVAFQNKSFNIARLLLQRAKQPNMIFRKYDDGNALHVAARYGKPNFARSLIGIRGIDLNLLDNKGQTPLSRAFSAGSLKVASALLEEQRTDLKIKNISGCSWSTDERSMISSKGTIVHFATTLRAKFAQAALKLLLAIPRLDPNVSDCAGRTPIYFLLEPGCPKDRAQNALHILLDDPLGRVKVSDTASNGRTVMHLAAESGRGLEQLLTRNDIDPNIRDILGQTPLHAATLHGTYEAIRLLLADSRIDPTILDNNKRSAFELLDMNSHGKSAVVYLTADRFDYGVSQGGTTALHVIAEHWTDGLEDYLRMLLGSGRIHPNQRSKEGNTALWYAVRGGHTKAVEILLSSKQLDPNLTDSRGESSLHLLVRSRDSFSKYRKMLASFFSHRNLDPNRLNAVGQTALHMHLGLQERLGRMAYQTVRVFVEDSRTDPNMQDTKNQTALHLAGRKAHQASREPRIYGAQIIKALLKDPRTNPNLKDYTGQTAFQVIVSNINLVHKRRTLVQSFINLPLLDPNIQDLQGRTVLHLAVAVQPEKRYETGAIDAINRLLKDERLVPGIVDNHKQTALWFAIGAGFTGAVRILLQDGRIDANAQDEKGNTILHQAVRLEHKETVELLLRSGIVDLSMRNGARKTAFAMANEIEADSGNLILLFRRAGELASRNPQPVEMFIPEQSSSDESVFDPSSECSN